MKEAVYKNALRKLQDATLLFMKQVDKYQGNSYTVEYDDNGYANVETNWVESRELESAKVSLLHTWEQHRLVLDDDHRISFVKLLEDGEKAD